MSQIDLIWLASEIQKEFHNFGMQFIWWQFLDSFDTPQQQDDSK